MVTMVPLADRLAQLAALAGTGGTSTVLWSGAGVPTRPELDQVVWRSPRDPQAYMRPGDTWVPIPEGLIVPASILDHTGKAYQLLGDNRSGLSWWSGAWRGAPFWSAPEVEEFGVWRGSPIDTIQTYPERATWAALKGSEWHITWPAGFPGRLVYGLPIVPVEATRDYAQVTSGAHDDVFDEIARDLVAAGRGNSIMRVGWEANGVWFAHASTAATADGFKAAFRRIVTRMRAIAPNLVWCFDIAGGTALQGQTNPLDSLTVLYPGDDVVDIVGVDWYDNWNRKATTDAEWETRALRTYGAPGLQDVADFARTHSKALAVPEWGVSRSDNDGGGGGDNAFFIQKMHDWFDANKDILAFEAYFNELDPAENVIPALMGNEAMYPLASALYKQLW